jgi:hypothetical protein
MPALSTHFIGVWVGPRAGLDVLEKRKIINSKKKIPDWPLFSVRYELSIYINTPPAE